jgi:hypothetical protein
MEVAMRYRGRDSSTTADVRDGFIEKLWMKLVDGFQIGSVFILESDPATMADGRVNMKLAIC